LVPQDACPARITLTEVYILWKGGRRKGRKEGDGREERNGRKEGKKEGRTKDIEGRKE
jgi:hypothetical protein